LIIERWKRDGGLDARKAAETQKVAFFVLGLAPSTDDNHFRTCHELPILHQQHNTILNNTTVASFQPQMQLSMVAKV
jgi:hypothetical protein